MTRPIDKVLDAFHPYGLQRDGDSGKQWKCICPVHDDHDPSLAISIGDKDRVLIHCFKGCDVQSIVARIGLKMADLRAADDDAPTLYELADAKGIPAAWLSRECGLTDLDGGGVKIWYQNLQGRNVLYRRRVKLSGKNHTMQEKGKKLQAYGQWRRRAAIKSGVKSVVIVEGESDCWTLWYHGVEGLGLPGATAARTLTADLLVGVEEIIVWREPGESGQQFAYLVGRQLKNLGLLGAAKLLTAEAVGAKDPSALFLADKEKFSEAWGVAMTKTTPMPEPVKPKKDAHVPGCLGSPAVPSPPSGEEEPQAPAPGYYPMTDVGNSQRLAHWHGRNLRWVKAWKSWLAWDGARWITEADGGATRAAIDAVRRIYGEAQAVEGGELRQRLAEHAVSSESARAIEAMVRLAKANTVIEMNFRYLDAEPWMLACPNGAIDLTTGQLRQSRRDDNATKQCATPYCPDAPCPLWEKFIRQVFDGKEEMIAYVRRLMGYCLTGDVSTHMLPVFWGGGGNGKGTLLNTLLDVIGEDYAAAAPAELLMARRGERHPAELADLFGKRLVACQETDDGCRLNEPLVKTLTGRDKIKARRMRENFWQFDPTHKLILSTNYKPVVRGTDRGIWRRLRLIPFTVTFDGADEDRGLPGRLMKEAEGILAWCVRGCLEWQQGERVPAEVQSATQEYQSESDVVKRFIDEECVVGRQFRCKAGDLYGAYKTWAERANERVFTAQRFGRRLGELGFKKHLSNGKVYDGIALSDGPNVPNSAQIDLLSIGNEVSERTDGMDRSIRSNDDTDRMDRFSDDDSGAPRAIQQKSKSVQIGTNGPVADLSFLGEIDS